jgi:hypothetical protein
MMRDANSQADACRLFRGKWVRQDDFARPQVGLRHYVAFGGDVEPYGHLGQCRLWLILILKEAAFGGRDGLGGGLLDVGQQCLGRFQALQNTLVSRVLGECLARASC